MSRIDTEWSGISTSSEFSETTEKALASLKAEANVRAAHGHAVMSAVMGYGAASEGKGIFGKITKAAKLFMIAFAMIAPCLLFMRELYW